MRVVKTKDIGARVLRGPNWAYTNQDIQDMHGSEIPNAPGLGTIVDDLDNMSENWVSVHWDSGATSYVYRIGEKGKYDLYYADEIDLMKVLEL